MGVGERGKEGQRVGRHRRSTVEGEGGGEVRSDGKGDPEVASNCGPTLGNTQGVWRVPGACRASLPGYLGRSRTMAFQKADVDRLAAGSAGWAPAPPLSLQGSGLLGMAQGGLPRAQPLLSCLVLCSITELPEGARPVLHRSHSLASPSLYTWRKCGFLASSI